MVLTLEYERCELDPTGCAEAAATFLTREELSANDLTHKELSAMHDLARGRTDRHTGSANEPTRRWTDSFTQDTAVEASCDDHWQFEDIKGLPCFVWDDFDCSDKVVRSRALRCAPIETECARLSVA